MDERRKRSRQHKASLLLIAILSLTRPSLVWAGIGDDEHLSASDTRMAGVRDADEADFIKPLLTLEVVLAYAQEHNPTIRAAHHRWVAAQQRPVQVSALDDPTFTYEGFNLPEHFDITRTDNNIIKLSQKLPFPGKRRLRGEIAMREAEIAKEEARMAEVTTRAEVKKAYYDLWLVQQNLRVYSRDKELMAQFATIAEKKYAVGQAAQPDVLRAQIELTRLVTRITTETLKVEEVRARLNTLLSRPPEAPLGMPEGAPKPMMKQTLAELAELALQTRPEITARTVTIHRDTAALALAQKAYLPDFEVVAERFFNGGRKDGFGVIFSATIPLAYREKYDAGVAETRAQLAAGKADLQAAHDTALAEVKSALVRAQTAVELVNLFSQTHIPQSEQALASSRIGYQTGKVDFLSLIDSLRSVEQVHLEHLAAAADFEKAYAELEQAVGQELPRI
jgi:outer membrane protein, heavy metal efflux system